MGSSNRADDAPRKEVKMYDPHVVVIIGLDTDDGPSHPQFDGESNDAPLLEADILFTYEHGVIQPISCKRDGKRLLVVFGRGRTRQLREANKRRIADGLQPWLLPVQIVQGDTLKMLSLKHGENSHRREQNPMARARAAYDLAQQMPEEKAAVVMGLGVPQFRNVIKLLDLAPAVAKEVTKGTISASAATPLTALSEAEQIEKLAELVAAGADGSKPTIRDVKAKVREANGKKVVISVASKKTQRRLLSYVQNLSHAANSSEKTLSWWEGVEDALKLVVGESDVNPKLVGKLDELISLMKTEKQAKKTKPKAATR
jgi:ParB-like chromosome segregation protein Spo0J